MNNQQNPGDQQAVQSVKRKRSFLKRFLPRTLLGRSLMILVLPVFLMQLITTIVFFDRHWSKMTDRLAFAVAGEVSVIMRVLEDGASQDTLKRIKAYVAQDLDLLMSFEAEGRLQDVDYASKHHIWESLVAFSLSNELERQVKKPFKIHADFQEKWIEISVQLEEGVLNVSLPQSRLFSSSGYIFLIWMFATSFMLLFVAVLFMRNQIRPIRRLAVAAEWFGRGRDSTTFKVEGAHEVRQAGRAFLDMRRRIKRQMEQRALMLAGVSHDLRTPLTRMKLQLEMMEPSADVKSLKSDLNDMDRMVHGYLDFVKGEGEEALESFSLNDLIEKILTNPTCVTAEIYMDIPEKCMIFARPMALERALSNVIMNGIKYSDTVWIRAEYAENERLLIYIEDDGPGIAEALRDDVFKPFFRVDASRNAQTGGVGLGLSIAMDIIHAHGGGIWLETGARHGGLKVCVRLPL